MREQRFALGTVLATFALLVVGGLVSGTGSSLACPDWPTCYGSFSPPMVGGIEYEHTHRVVASMVGLLTIALAVLLWRRREDDRGLMRLGILAVVLVIFQGLLGGLTVILRLPTAVSSAHLATAMAFFALTVVIWRRARRLPDAPDASARPAGPGAARWAGLSALVVYLQIVLGGLVRHTGAGLACPDYPLCNGALWPVGGHPAAPVHALHRHLGLVVAAVVIVVAWRAFRRAAPGELTRKLAVTSGALVLLQVGLGIASVLTRLQLHTVTAHLAVGTALFAVQVVAWSAARHPARGSTSSSRWASSPTLAAEATR